MIDSIKDLEKLLKLCRKQGVTEIKFGGVEFKLGDLPQGESKFVTEPIEAEDPFSNFPPGMLTKEQAIFYSSGGHPDDDPENVEAPQ